MCLGSGSQSISLYGVIKTAAFEEVVGSDV